MHDYDLPVGMAPQTWKAGGKLKSVLELGVGVFPYAEVLQRALAAGMIRACSVGFDPIRWTYNKARDGVDFHEISLREISAVTVPCCAGAVLDGPVKSLKPAQARRQGELEVIRLKAGG
jgi:phage head maturation protease